MDHDFLLEPFERFTFEPLRFEQFADYLHQSRSSAPSAEAKEAFENWLLSFHRKALLFYQSQYNRHEHVVYTQFRRKYRIAEGDNPGGYGREGEWATWQVRSGLNAHREASEYLIECTSRAERDLQNLVRSRQTEQGLRESNALYQNFSNYPAGAKSHREIDGLWFDSTIDNSPLEAQELREMPYEEKYLFSTHWKRVRAAMLLINRAVCQAEECHMMDESWYGENWETDLHVHHLDYSNKGNERFADLTLLCSKHHRACHNV